MKINSKDSFKSFKKIKIGKKFCNIFSLKEAEKNGVDGYPLYTWTKRTIENKEKVKKHSEAFAFYYKEEQVYSKKIAENLHNDLLVLYDAKEIKELRLIDTNPDNNPQPPPKK